MTVKRLVATNALGSTWTAPPRLLAQSSADSRPRRFRRARWERDSKHRSRKISALLLLLPAPQTVAVALTGALSCSVGSRSCDRRHPPRPGRFLSELDPRSTAEHRSGRRGGRKKKRTILMNRFAKSTTGMKRSSPSPSRQRTLTFRTLSLRIRRSRGSSSASTSWIRDIENCWTTRTLPSTLTWLTTCRTRWARAVPEKVSLIFRSRRVPLVVPTSSP